MNPANQPQQEEYTQHIIMIGEGKKGLTVRHQDQTESTARRKKCEKQYQSVHHHHHKTDDLCDKLSNCLAKPHYQIWIQRARSQ